MEEISLTLVFNKFTFADFIIQGVIVIIEIRDLTKYYGSVLALDNVTVKIPSGAVGLLGPNGSGKTTLIRILLGLIDPTKGDGQVLGHDIKTEQRYVADKVGYMPEYPCLPDFVSAQKFVAFLGRLSGLPYTASMQRAHDVLYYVGLGEARYRNMDTYSAGMKQRVKLAAALVHDPELIITDEPTNGMDPKGRDQMLMLLKNLSREEGKSVLVSSHLLPDVERVCEKVTILNRGALLHQGEIGKIHESETDIIIVRIKGDIKTFQSQLEKSNITSSLRGNTSLLVKLQDENTYDRICEIAAKNDYQLRYMGKDARTLEDLFIGLFENQVDNRD
ncbi:MAG: ABC transporter ATP-binding protein [Candidatus Hermodarchaeota archaeon]